MRRSCAIVTCLLLTACNEVFGLDPTEPAPDAAMLADVDQDGVENERDNCPSVANNDQLDLDTDGAGDACDGCAFCEPCAVGPSHDEDADLMADGCDNCPAQANPEQANVDGDALGDPCDLDDATVQRRLLFDGFGVLEEAWQPIGGRWVIEMDDVMGTGLHPFGYVLAHFAVLVDEAQPFRIDLGIALPPPPTVALQYESFGIRLLEVERGNEQGHCMVEYQSGWNIPTPTDEVALRLTHTPGAQFLACSANGAASAPFLGSVWPFAPALFASLPTRFHYIDVISD